MPIRVLSEALSSRIAAGEVIERPASVVKELVENSLDAGATRIDVDVRDGGIRSITVVDNGGGIRPSELPVAFERFATSKIDESSDLTGIETLGFRGEALPSIASVASVEAVSRVPGAEGGARVLLEYGRQVTVETAGAPPGTTIRVSGLFRNVPARLKFLSSPGRELSRIQQLVAMLALVYPGVSFRLVSDGAVRLNTPGNGDGLEAIRAVYGQRTAEAMLRLETEPRAVFSANGWVSAPFLNRGNRSYITLSVNGRWVQSRRLLFAIEQAYHGFLPEKRFPLAVVNALVPFTDVDVNVHPAKAEVRFLREDIVFATVQRAIRAALTESSPVQGMGLKGRMTGTRPQVLMASQVTLPDASPLASAATQPQQTTQVPTPLPAKTPAAGHMEAQAPGDHTAPLPLDSASAPTATPKAVLPVLRVIGQAQETYIVAEGPDGVYLIDQHAAHERVLYEQIRDRLQAGVIESQPLLAPETVNLAPQQAGVIEANAAELAAAGFVIEPFGPGTVLLRAVPQLFVARNGSAGPADTLLRLLDSISDGRRTDSWSDRLMYTMACHAAVRAGRRMSTEESRELVRLLEAAKQPHTCPHGRPTMIHLAAGALEREFGRR